MTEQELYVFMHEHFSYDPEEGVIRIKKRYHGSQPGVGEPAGQPPGIDRGRVISVAAKGYRSSNLIWLMSYGYLVKKPLQIDHINGDVQNEKLSNLRVVTPSQNSLNRKYVNSVYGTGVQQFVLKRKKKDGTTQSWVYYRASLKIGGWQIASRALKTPEEAQLLRKQYEEKYGGGYTRATSKQRET